MNKFYVLTWLALMPLFSLRAQSISDLDYPGLQNHLQQLYQISVFADSATAKVVYLPDSLKSASISVILDHLELHHRISHIYYNRSVVILYRNYRQIPVSSPLPTSQQRFQVNGYLLDAQSGQPINEGTIIIPEGNLLINVDRQGHFQFDLPQGTYSVKAIGQGTFESNFELVLDQNRQLNIELFEKTVELDEVVVSTTAEEVNVINLQPGSLTIEIEELRKIPAFLGEIDVSRAVITLPGVSTVGEGATGFNVRGGNIDQNLILMDGMSMFNSSHMLGFFSAFNPDVLRDFTLYKGLIPAEMGGRSSSVLEVNQKGANNESLEFSASVGPLNGKLFVNTPILKNTSGLSLGVRGAYPNYVLRSFPDESVVSKSRASYFDISAKYDHETGQESLLTLNTYISGDRFNFSADTTFTYSNLLVGLRYASSLGGKWKLNLHGFLSKYVAGIEDRTLNQQSDFENGIQQTSFKVDVSHESERSRYSLGVESNYYRFQTGRILPVTEGSEVSPQVLADRKAVDIAAYAAMRLQLKENLGIQVGIRTASFFNLGPDQFLQFEPNTGKDPETVTDTLHLGSGEFNHVNTSIEPRISINYRMNQNTSLKAGYSRTFQYIHLFSNTVASLPADLWRPSDPNLDPVSAHILSLGYFRNFREHIYETSLEVFYKDIENIIDFTNGTRILLNPDLVYNTLQGDAEAYGVEMLVKKSKGSFRARLAYTYSRVWAKYHSAIQQERLNDGASFPANFDRPHDINLFGSWQLGRLWNFSTNFVYTTGRPISLPEKSFRFGGAIGFSDVERNNFRIPDFHRLDLAITLEGSNRKDRKLITSWTFSVYNVYGRKNVFSVFINGEDGRPRQLSVLGAPFPSLTFNMKLN